MKVMWKGAVLAESQETVEIEGNAYFPPQSLRREHFQASKKETACAWKGTASYYDIHVGADINRDAAWSYAAPKDAAKQITGYVAFWRGVEVVP